MTELYHFTLSHYGLPALCPTLKRHCWPLTLQGLDTGGLPSLTRPDSHRLYACHRTGAHPRFFHYIRISETGVILWFFDRLRKAPALLAPEPSFFLESYFASTTEILISFSVSLRSNAPPSATLTRSSYNVPSESVSTALPASSVIDHSSLPTSASFPSAP